MICERCQQELKQPSPSVSASELRPRRIREVFEQIANALSWSRSRRAIEWTCIQMSREANQAQIQVVLDQAHAEGLLTVPMVADAGIEAARIEEQNGERVLILKQWGETPDQAEPKGESELTARLCELVLGSKGA